MLHLAVLFRLILLAVSSDNWSLLWTVRQDVHMCCHICSVMGSWVEGWMSSTYTVPTVLLSACYFCCLDSNDNAPSQSEKRRHTSKPDVIMFGITDCCEDT